MHKLTIIYAPQADPDGFDSHYRLTHLPLVRAMPGLQRVEVGLVQGDAGESPEHHLITELWFSSMEALESAFASEAGMAAAADVANFAPEGPSTFVSELWDF
jgi:uncharacterized protein (TIGR02118 family)